MKTKTILFYGAAAAALAYFFVLRKKTTSAAPPVDPPVDTQDAIEPPIVDPARTRQDTELALSNLLNGKGGGPRVGNSGAPNRLSGYTQVFENRVYTKVKDFYGPNANTGRYPDSKRLGLYQRIWNNLSAKGVSNPNNATLGQIGPALKDIGTEGFNFQH